ncbi:hypothetical protein C8R45DRAFT_1004964 [Mycena sanguinolenta]|nr:hypothetical protein C8R45DRAFT_1004964 [Mycena sanguinolenta]
MSHAGKKKRSKRKEKDDARELWCPSPTPSEDWGSDADVDFEFDIIGEEVSYNGKLKYEVKWHDWQRSDGTSTTWEDPTDNAAIQNAVNAWDFERIADLPDTTDVELWGTIDIVNTRTRLRKQGYEEPTEQEMAGFQADGDALVRRMEELMAESKDAFPHLFLPNSASRSTTQTSVSPSQAQASRVHVNAEAGPSRLGPHVAPAKSSRQLPPTASSSRLPAKQPPTPFPPPQVPPHRAGSPAISVSSSVDSVEFISTKPAPGGKRRAASPPKGVLPSPPKRRGLPSPREKSDKLRPTSSGTLSKPSSITRAEKSASNTPRSSVPPLGGAHGKRKATSPPRAAQSPPPKLRALALPRDGASASLPTIRATISGSDKLRSTASSASISKLSPASASQKCTPISVRSASTLTATVSASTSPSAFTLPRRSLTRRATVDDDVDDDVFRKCACGTLLAPPDVYRLAVCDTCRSTDDRRSIRSSSQGWRSDVSTVRASSIASTSRELQGWKNEKEAQVPNRKGKAPESRKSLRLQVESAWTALAQGCDGEDSPDSAAGITFVNDVDAEEIPPSLHGGAFVYLEDRYQPAETLPFELYPDSATPLADAGAFMFCHCEQCDEFDGCCQDTSGDLHLRFAYTDGLFNFTYRSDDVVVECNPYCTCPTTCGNRVAQRPRRIPIEVFKTERCGWGVRATEDVVRGTVVGVYTGKLIPRAEAEELRGDRKQYCFDLDYNEEGVPLEETYSVDAFECGNWTRFINHSCSPNLHVQPVVYDTLPYQRIAFLAFIALGPIPARTEFTFDYDPREQRDYEKAVAEAKMAGGKGKTNVKLRRPRGAANCVCGTEKCREWVRT